MAYDEELAEQIRAITAGEPGLTEKRMFGGLAFLLDGAMAVAASSDGGLMVRVDPADSEEHLQDPAASRMVMRGREMAGWLRVAAAGLADGRLEHWVAVGLDYARSLPAR